RTTVMITSMPYLPHMRRILVLGRRAFSCSSPLLESRPPPLLLSTVADLEGIPRRRLHISNMPANYNLNGLVNLLEENFGRLRPVNNARMRLSTPSCALVVLMQNIAEAKKAVAADLTLGYEGRPLKIEFAKFAPLHLPQKLGRRLVIEGLAREKTLLDMWPLLTKSAAFDGLDIRDITIAKDNTGNVQVYMITKNDAIRAYVRMTDEPFKDGDDTFYTAKFLQHETQKDSDLSLEPSRRVYFYHYEGTPAALKSHISAWCEYTGERRKPKFLVNFVGGTSSGIIEFESVQWAERALRELRGSIIESRWIFKAHFALARSSISNDAYERSSSERRQLDPRDTVVLRVLSLSQDSEDPLP
ncbi:unnamed protein product, partial [Mycena citricolor]